MRRSIVLGPLVAQAVLILAVPLGTAHASIVVNQTPSHLRGEVSDTGFTSSPGTDLSWQRVADNIALDATAAIRHVTWWGFYLHDSVPSQQETMKIRFYAARAPDGLPGDALLDLDLVNPARTATGISIPGVPPGTGSSAREYRFETDLPSPVLLNASTPYWIEIVQIGLPNSGFYWESTGSTPLSIATISDYSPIWALWGYGDQAIQLSTVPETTTISLILLGVTLLGRRNRNQKWGQKPFT